MYKIIYDVKNTSANTVYMNISKNDMDHLIAQIIGIQSYFSELSLCPNKDVKDLMKWYQGPCKTLPYHSQWKKHNSPQTFIGGVLNNLLYGFQKDLTLIQANHLQNILNNYSVLVDAIKELNIDLQKATDPEPVMFTENLWQP